MRLLNLILFISVFGFYAQARELVFTAQNKSYFYVQSVEHDVFYIDEYRIQKNKFQRFVKKYTFQTKDEVALFIKQQKLEVAPSSLLAKLKNAGHFIQTEDASDVIWESDKSWDLEWEKKYSDWIQNSTGPEFFETYGVATDCADVAIAFRWIFARMNKLPIANSLAGTGQIFSHETLLSGWAQLPTADEWHKDSRFMKALNYLLDNTYTHSLMKDSYPIAIGIEAFTPGVHHLSLHGDSGHTNFVSHVGNEAGGVAMMASTTPRNVRTLFTEIYSQYDAYENQSHGGFFKMRWPLKVNNKWQLVNEEKMSSYSLEQYDPKFYEEFQIYSDAIENRLGVSQTPEKKFDMAMNLLWTRLDERVGLVKEGYEVCKVDDCAPGTPQYEAWSTINRDARIVELIERLDTLTIGNDQLQQQWYDFQTLNTLLIEDVEVKIYDIVTAFVRARYSVDPRTPIFNRWGLDSSGHFVDQDQSLIQIKPRSVDK